MAKAKYDRQEAINCYLKHKSLDKAAKELGCSKSTLHRIIKNANINLSGNWKDGQQNQRPPTGSNSIAEAVASGDKRNVLVALRDKLAVAIDNCESDRDLPALTKRFWEVQKELETIPDPSKTKISKHDRLKKHAQR